MSNKTFLQACLDGDVLLEEIDEYINNWHKEKTDLSIYKYLGLSKKEYDRWLENPLFLKLIIFSHKQDTPLSSIEKWDEGELVAARAASQEEAHIMINWLKNTGRLEQHE